MTDEIIATARELGAALNATSEVQAFLRADEAFRNNRELQQLENQIEEAYAELVKRQRSGAMILKQEVNDFYRLREQFTTHPLVIEREACLASVKTIFEQAGTVLNSILSVDYTELAEH